MTAAGHGLRRERRTSRTRRRPRRLWSIVTTVALGVLVLLAVLTVGVPLLLGAQPYSVLTGSMRPGIPPGSLIAVRAVPFENIRVGDVVTYQLESGRSAVVTHRVVGRSEAADGERMLTTRGDANDLADALPVREVQVRGVVVFAVPLLGYPGSILNGPSRSGIVVAGGVALILYGVFVLTRSMRRGRGRAAKAAVVIVAGVIAPWSATSSAPASAAAANDPLRVSADGENWVTDGSVAIVDGRVRLAPGGATTGQLWVRNDSPDAATATLDVSARPATESPIDAAAAADMRISIDDSPVGAGRVTVSARIDAGGERRFEIETALDEESQNDSRRGTVLVAATVNLAQIVEQDPPPRPSDGGRDGGHSAPSDALPATGGASPPFALIALGGAGAILLGRSLRRSSRSRRM